MLRICILNVESQSIAYLCWQDCSLSNGNKFMTTGRKYICVWNRKCSTPCNLYLPVRNSLNVFVLSAQSKRPTKVTKRTRNSICKGFQLYGSLTYFMLQHRTLCALLLRKI